MNIAEERKIKSLKLLKLLNVQKVYLKILNSHFNKMLAYLEHPKLITFTV